MTTGNFSLFFISLLISQQVAAQTFTAVKDTAAMQKKLAEESKKIMSIDCSFTQEKNMSMLSDRVISNGKFYFKKDNKVRLEYLQPVNNLVVMNHGKMLIRDVKKSIQTDVHQNKLFLQLNNIILGSINGSLFSSKEFTVVFFESAGLVKVELKPVSKILRNFLNNIVIVLEKKDFTATRIEMHEPSGDNTILTFSDKKINGQVDDSLFAVR